MKSNDSTKDVKKFNNPNALLPTAMPNVTPTIHDDIGQSQGLENAADGEKYNNYTFYGDVFFAFIDVLGFKKAFEEKAIISSYIEPEKETSVQAPAYDKVFELFFDLINNSNFYNSTEARDRYAGQTSDTIYFYTRHPNILLDFLKIFSYLNLYAMSLGIFFRGGVSHGGLYVNQPHQFYGDSVINAYQFESDIAKNPILLIDDFTTKELTKLKEYPSDFIIGTGNKRNYLDPFAFWSGNYKLGSLVQNIESIDIRPEMIERILNEKKMKHEYDARNYDKYIFLINEFERIMKNKSDKIVGGNYDYQK